MFGPKAVRGQELIFFSGRIPNDAIPTVMPIAVYVNKHEVAKRADAFSLCLRIANHNRAVPDAD